MTGTSQTLPVRIYHSAKRLMIAAPMPGLEPPDISVSIEADRVIICGDQRGPHQHDLGLLLAEWTIGPYYREVRLAHPVNGQLANATYGNGVLVLSMPKMKPGEPGVPAEIRLQAVTATLGERVGHVGRDIRALTTDEHRRQKHSNETEQPARA